MGPLTDDRGQALVVGAVVMAIAVIAVVGLRAAQDRMVEGVRAHVFEEVGHWVGHDASAMPCSVSSMMVSTTSRRSWRRS